VVRIRAYPLVLAMPMIMALAGFIMLLLPNSLVGANSPMIGWWIIFAAIVLHAFFGLVIACPKCGKSPYTVGPYRGPLGFAGKPLPDRICSNCGHDFAAR
jgi:hypothetical protein